MSMRPDEFQLLTHIAESTTLIIQWTADKTREDYSQDSLLRSAVERQFIIIGESVNLLLRVDPSIEVRITDYRSVISFRNLLVHGFFQVDDSRVWDIVTEKVPVLHREISELLREQEER